MDLYIRLIQSLIESSDDDDEYEVRQPVLRRQNAIYIEPVSNGIINEYIMNDWGFESNVNSLLVMQVYNFFTVYGYLPTKYQFMKSIIENCFCGIIFTDHELAIQTGLYLLDTIKIVPECSYIQHAIDYHNQEHRHPSIEELRTYISNIYRITNDPEGYYQETKQSTPTPNLSSLTPTSCDKDECNCGLCFEEINKEEQCYILPCSHVFHSDKEKCIDATIVDWLKNNRTCPICKQEVVL